jgi:hypothetical protein
MFSHRPSDGQVIKEPLSMNILKCTAAQWSILLLATAGVAAGCNSGPTASAPPGIQSANGHAGPSELLSTRVKIYNSGSSTIFGTGSAPCWTISPTPLPSVGPGSYSGIETLSHNPLCGVSTLNITYQTISGADTACTFETTYSGGFSYSVDNSPTTACTATHSTNVTFDELFSYDPAGQARKQTRTLKR